HRGAIYSVVANREQSFVHFIQRKCSHLRAHPDLGREFQEVPRILPGHVGYAADLPLTPEQRVVIELRDAVEMDCVNRDHTAFPKRRERRDDHIPAWSESERAVEFHGRLVLSIAHPPCTQRLCKLTVAVAASGNVNFAFPRVQYGY